MDKTTTESPKLAIRQHSDRLDSLNNPSKTASGRSNSLILNDDWAYRDRGLAPEKEPTRERVTTEDHSATAASLCGVSEEEGYALEDVKLNIYQTYAGRRRAKVPDKEEELVAVVADAAEVNGAPPKQPRAGTPTGRRRSRWKEFKAVTKVTAVGKVDDEKTKLRHVMLHWEKAAIRGLEKVVLNARVPQGETKRKIESQNYVSWQHSQLNSMTFQKLEELVIGAKCQGVQESEIRLTRRLLKRVRLESERPFVGGSFLTPRALRYDSLDSSKYNADKCCTFLAFPFFAVRGEQQKKAFGKGGQEHPIRTLLQSVYRLNDTAERDKTQSIRMLTRKSLRSCIEAEETDISKVSLQVNEELIFVPQLWALVLGLDRLITLGSISDASLQGRNIEVKEETESGSKRRCSLVRIRFKNQRRVENLTYPIEQCASWFGLVNKQQQIRAVLKKEREVSDPKKYKLQIHGQLVGASTWASIQKSTQAEVLDIWMETPKQKVAKVSVESAEEAEISENGPQRNTSGNQENGIDNAEAGPSNAVLEEKRQTKQKSDTGGLGQGPSTVASKKKSQDQDLDQEEDSPETGTTDASPVKFDRLEKVPIVLPFFHWRVIDESGDTDECPLPERVDRFMNYIYRNLPAAVGETTERFANAHTIMAKPTTDTFPATKKKPSFRGKASEDVTIELIQVISTKSKEHGEIARDTIALLAKVLNCFLPRGYKPQSAPMKLFWGVLHEIVSLGSYSYLTDLHDKLYTLHTWVEHIHLGVHYKRTKTAPGGHEQEEDAISESAILLSSMVDAFGAIFNILVEAASDVIGDAKQPQCGKKVSNSYREAHSLLETARDELIVEASGVAAIEHIGPVLTPEAILIMHMERLVCGVYKNGNVDIISILEECLERLALKVRYRYSRRLLQMINAFEEEVAAVHDVLLQQRRVLGEFRGYLKPYSFDTPSTARKMRFDFEQKGIERVLVTLREQLKNCAELRERARVLAVQNVHLVETLQDDNGRAIFIFTFITVLFLPLTFVAGFFGMNLQGINGTTEKATLFWKIAVPMTGGITILCFAVIIWGERMWFGIASVSRLCAKMYRKRSSVV